MTGKLMKNVTGFSEQAKLLKENNTEGGLRNKHSKDINKNIEKSGKQGKSLSAKSSLDKVADDIEHILGKLNVFSADNLKTLEPIELKIVQKEFFKAGNRRNQSASKKSSISNTKGKTSNKQDLSHNSKNIVAVNKKRSVVLSKIRSYTNTNSNHTIRKIPLTKSALLNFKHKIILNSNQVFKFPEKIKHQDKEYIAKNVKKLLEAALKESEHKRKPPVIDVGNFIQQSLMLANPNDFPELKKIVERRREFLPSETDSGSDWSVRLNTMTKKVFNGVNNENKRQQEQLATKEKINILEREGTNKTNSLNHSPPQRNDGRVSNKSENDANKNKSNHLLHPIVQSCKTTPNSGYTSRSPPKTQTLHQGQSKTTGNLIVHRKMPPSKSMVNINSAARRSLSKIGSKHFSNLTTVLPHKFVNAKQITSGNSQVIEINRRMVNQTRSKSRTRSNSTLNSINIPANHKTSVKNVTSLTTRPSAAKNNSTTASKLNAITRNGSAYGEIRSKMLSAPERISSSISSKLASNRNYFGRRHSSHSSFSNSRSTISTIRSSNPVKLLRDEVSGAIKDRKTFTVRGNYTAVRKALVKRGWVERLHITNSEKLEQQMNCLRHRTVNELEDMIHIKDLNDICKKLIKSKLLANHQVDLYWGPNYDAFAINPDKVKLTKINKFRRDVFSYTSKQGLCDAVKDAHWFNFPGLANIKHPRTYALARNGETKYFIKDFRRTAAMSLLKWIIRSHDAKDCKIVSSSGKIPLEAFQFAANECCKLIIEANNEDIDQPLKEASDHEWNQFLEYYYKILHIGNHFQKSCLETEKTIVIKSAFIINKLSPHYPHIKMDGAMNIWILKPAAGSQGKGIHICRTLQYIMRTVKNNSTVKYIAQKYIERPLLIFNTKFDIRQWFLISSAVPLTIWMYKECYLRFSSQTYNLRKLHESIHLTNNSVQQRYQNTSRDITLPNYNMWDSQQFKTYLSNIGFPEVYKTVTYKGMKECIIAAVLIHQDKIDKRKNSFELYGADFMLTEDFHPWLIEINSSPALYASTPVTSRMCPQVLEDTIKVVVDYAANPRAKTGSFEMIYRQKNLSSVNDVNVKGLKVSGKPLPNNYFCSDAEKRENEINSLTENSQSENESSQTGLEIAAKSMKETLESLLKFIHNEKRKRQKRRLIATGTDPIEPLDKKVKAEVKSSSTCTNRTRSFTNLKSQWDQIASNDQISMAEEDVNMIDEALHMLKDNKNCEIIGCLLEIVEKILNETKHNKNEM